MKLVQKNLKSTLCTSSTNEDENKNKECVSMQEVNEVIQTKLLDMQNMLLNKISNMIENVVQKFPQAQVTAAETKNNYINQ